MFNKYAKLYFEMANNDFVNINEAFYRIHIDDENKLLETLDIIFYKKSVENFLLAPEKIRIRKGTILENRKASLIEEIKKKIAKEDIKPSEYDYVHFFCNDIDRHGLFHIKGETSENIIREISNIILVGKTTLDNEEK